MKKNTYKSKTFLQPWQKIILAILLGIVVGLVFGQKAACLKPVGILFIHAIQMMVLPVVFTAIVCAVISIDDLGKMRRLAFKAIGVYTVSMAFSSVIGLTVASWVMPGKGLVLAKDATLAATKVPSLMDAVTNIIPANPVQAFATGNILQILVFALILGVSINLAGEKGKLVAEFFRSFSQVAIKLVHLVMKFAPYGIFALMAWVFGEYGLAALLPLIKFVMTVYACCILLIVLYYSSTLFCYVKMNPLVFIKHIRDAMLLAFSTSSSAATLPVTMECAERKLGISKTLSGFLLPLGTTMNLNGLSIYLSVAVVFAANIYGVELNFSQYFTVVFTIILTCMGAGGIPGSAIMVMSAVMGSVGLPLGAIPLIAGVDRLNDMAQTTTNVTGDLFSALVIAKSENELLDTAAPIKIRGLHQSKVS